MTVTTTPSWTAAAQSIIAIQMLARGATPLRGTIDLTGKVGGRVVIGIMRSGATAIDVAQQIRVRNVHGSAAPYIHGAPIAAFTTGRTTAVQGVAAATGNNAGVTSLTLNAAKTFVAGPSGDINIGVDDRACKIELRVINRSQRANVSVND